MSNIMTEEENIKISELFEANQILQLEIDQTQKDHDRIADRLLDSMLINAQLRELMAKNNIVCEY